MTEYSLMDPTTEAPHLSIVVSTRNRADDVRQFLERLALTQVRTGTRWELILVDNGSTDGTAAVVQAFVVPAAFELRYLCELRPGKSHGVNAGIRASRGSIIALTDDDAWVTKGWVQGILDYFHRNPDANCIGGMVRRAQPDLAKLAIRESPDSLSVDLATFSAMSIQLIGCNMAVRRSLLERVGLFDTQLGPGTGTRAGEDLDFLYRIVADGSQLHYVPDIVVFHNHGRRTSEQVSTVKDGYLLGRGAFYCKQILALDPLVTRWAYWEVASSLKQAFSKRNTQTGIRPARVLVMLVRGAAVYLFRRRKLVRSLSDDTKLVPTSRQPGWLYVMPWDLTVVGGVTQVVQNMLARTLDHLHHEPVLLINDWHHPNPVRTRSQRLLNIRLRVYSPWSPGRKVRGLLGFLIRLPGTLRRLLNTIDREQIDVINIHYPDVSALTWLLASRLSRHHPRVILAFHGLDASHAIRTCGIERLLWKRILSQSDQLVACSRNLANQLAASFSGSHGRIQVVDNGVDADALLAAAQTATSSPLVPFIMSIGTFERKKGHDILVKAFDAIAMRFPELQLVIAGRTGPRADVEALESLRDKSISHERITYLKDLPHRETMSLLAQAHCFVLASRSEPFGIVILEAAILGIPIIATEICGALHRLGPHPAITSVACDNTERLSVAMERILGSLEISRESAGALATKVIQELDWNAVMGQWKSLYDKHPASGP